MRLFEIITEEYKTVVIDKTTDKTKFGDEVWSILDKSYAKLGGFKSYDNKTHMFTEFGMWILVFDEDENIIASIIFKNQHGNKLVGLGTDGQPQSKNELIHVLRKLRNQKNFWAEVSGPLEKLFNTLDIPLISNNYAKKLTGKEILEHDEDGYHYVRYIAGQPTRKIIMGYPEI